MTTMSRQPHTAIRVISLSAAPERRQAFARSAVEAGCDWEFFDAHTTPMHGLSYDEKRVTGIYGRKLHPVYLFEVKKPSESRHAWDLYKLITTTPADQAWRPLSDHACPLLKS